MLAIALCCAIRQTAPVTLTVRAEPIREVCAKLSDATHLSLSVRGTLGDEPLIAKFANVPLATAMSKIAEATDATWTRVGETSYELARTPAIEKREYADHIAMRAKSISDEIRRSAASIELDKPLNAIGVEALLKARNLGQQLKGIQRSDAIETADRKLPPNRLLIRLLAAIDPTQLAAIPPYGCEVFSSRPNATQHPLPPAANEAIAQFAQERRLMIEGLAKLRNPATHDSVYSPFPVESKAAWNGNGTTMVKVGRDQFGGDISATMTVLDESGRVLHRVALRDYTFRRAQPPTFPVDPVVTLSPDSTLVHDALAEGAILHKGSTQKPIGKAARALLLDTAHHDPLSFSMTDVLFAAAEANHVDLVAVPDDSISFADINCKAGKTKCDQYCSLLTRKTAFDVSAGWLTVTPVDRYETRLTRLDRLEMARYIRSRDANGFSTLDSKLELAAAQPYLESPNLLTYYEMAMGPSVRTFDGDRKAFRFFGTLSPEQRVGLISGGSLSAGQLSPQQLSALDDWVFHSFRAEMCLLKKGVGGTFLLYEGGGISGEPTLAVPDGLAEHFTISANATTSPAVVCYDDNGGMVMDAETLALNMAMHDYPDEDEGVFQEPTGYREGKTMVISLQVRFDPDHILADRLNGLDFDMSKPVVSLDGLSSSFRNRYAKELAVQKARRRSGGVKPAGTTSPPPPR
ncbi:MAG TPA: hypothetical protein VG820_13295 [Fimbriimonadaceae bacterium]|nr:hypothetical protein [Fimbriimonadaceae bacterium]